MGRRRWKVLVMNAADEHGDCNEPHIPLALYKEVRKSVVTNGTPRTLYPTMPVVRASRRV